MLDLQLRGKIAEFYPYRRARVGNYGIVITGGKELSDLVRSLLTDNGYSMDNHICFKMDNGICYLYSDHTLYVGSEIIERNW